MENMLTLNIKLNHFHESTMQINEILRDLLVLSYCMSNISFRISYFSELITKYCSSMQIRDWSKSIGGGGGGPEHLEMGLIKNT